MTTVALTARTIAEITAAQTAAVAFNGQTVTYVDRSGYTVTGKATVSGLYTPGEFDTRTGFCVTIQADNGDFIATGIWSDDACDMVGAEATITG
jgi:hypothetical protein